MGIVRVRDFVELYRMTAKGSTLHALSGRGDRKELTHFTNQRIAERLAVTANDVVVDVGCGDGSFLRSLAGVFRSGIGIAPTEEEVGLLREAHKDVPNLRFEVGRAERLGLGNGSATKLVCNGVLILLPDATAAATALSEFARVVEPGGAVWIGEHPEIDELDSRAAYGGSLRKRFELALRPGGLRTSLAVTRDVLLGYLGKRDVVIPPQKIFHCRREQLAQMAGTVGLALKWSDPHFIRDGQGQVQPSPSRRDYLFESRPAVPSESV